MFHCCPQVPDVPIVLQLLSDVARGMAYIHSKNILHGKALTVPALTVVVNRRPFCMWLRGATDHSA